MLTVLTYNAIHNLGDEGKCMFVCVMCIGFSMSPILLSMFVKCSVRCS